MNFRNIFLLIPFLIPLLVYSKSILSVPRASMIKWVKGSYGNYSGAAYREKVSPLPIWVSISFDKQVNEKFVNDYFMFLVGQHPQRNKKYRYIYTITVPANTSRSEFEDKVDKANRHFDPEIERQEQLAIAEAEAQVEREAANLAAMQAEAKRKVEEERIALEAKKKAEEERRAIVRAQAEEQARVLAVKKEQERIAAEKQQKIIEQEKAQQESRLHSYSVTKLPADFHILGGYYAFNNYGQIAGCISQKATQWTPIYQRGRRGGSYCINAHEDKYADAVAAYWDQSSGLHLLNENKTTIAKAINDSGVVLLALGKQSEKKQTCLWDLSTGRLKMGPIGEPYLITNTNKVLVHDGEGTGIWNSVNNFMDRDSRMNVYMAIDDKIYPDHYLMMNKKGSSIRVSSNLFLRNGASSYLLLPEGDSRILALNDNDQVAALVDVKWGSKTFKAIQLLDKAGNSSRSKIIKELVGYSQISIVGFNIRGQLLLSADKDYLLLNPNH